VPWVSRMSSGVDESGGKASLAAFSSAWPTGARSPVSGTRSATGPPALPVTPGVGVVLLGGGGSVWLGTAWPVLKFWDSG